LAAATAGCKNTGPASDKAAPGTAEPARPGSADEPVDAQMLAAAQAALDAAYKGTDRTPPQSATKPTPGKKVWIISPGQIGESASIPTNAAKEAGELIGWNMTLYDRKL